MPDQNNGQKQNVGKVIEIKGVVIDAVFTGGLPEINSAVRITVPEREGRPAIELIAEVQQHLGDDRVRTVAMDSTDGVPRGVDVIDTGGPITVPVGDQTLGRLRDSGLYPGHHRRADRLASFAVLKRVRGSERR